MRERQSERRVAAAVFGHEGQRQHAGDRQQRPAHSQQRCRRTAARTTPRRSAARRPTASRPGKWPCPWPTANCKFVNRPSPASAARVGAGARRRDRRGAVHPVVQAGHVQRQLAHSRQARSDASAAAAVERLLERRPAPEKHQHRQQQPGHPGVDQLSRRSSSARMLVRPLAVRRQIARPRAVARIAEDTASATSEPKPPTTSTSAGP